MDDDDDSLQQSAEHAGETMLMVVECTSAEPGYFTAWVAMPRYTGSA